MGLILLLSLNSPHAHSYLHALHASLGVFCLCGRPLAGAELQMMLCNRQETEYEAQQVYLTLPSRAQHSRKGENNNSKNHSIAIMLGSLI